MSALDVLGETVGHGGHHRGGGGCGYPVGVPWPWYPPVYAEIPVVDEDYGLEEIVRGDNVELDDIAEFLGAISDTQTDYDYGKAQVLALVQYFNVLGRPKEFEAAVEGVYRKYENAKAIWDEGLTRTGLLNATSKWFNATAMKQAGADAAELAAKIQKAYPQKTATTPGGVSNAVYKPHVDDGTKSWWEKIPWWGWGIAGTVALGGVAYFAVPAILPLIAASRARKALAA